MLNVGWHIPNVRSDEVAALDLLTVLLGQGDASRLTLEVKRERGLVNEIYASAYTPQDPGLLIVGSSLKFEHVKPALMEMLRQTYRLRREEFTADELARAKRIVESDAIFPRETVQGQARKLGFFETVVGHVDEEEKYLQAVAAANASDLRETAERYLRAENLSMALFQPQGQPTFSTDELFDVASAAEKDLSGAVTKRAGRPRTSVCEAIPRGVAAPRNPGGVVSEVLPNGIHLLVKEDHTVPLVAFRASWLGGLRSETAKNNGINQMLARLLMRGTEKRSARDLARAVDDLAGSIGGSAGRNSYGAQGEFLSVDLAAGLELFAEVLLRPALDPAELERGARPHRGGYSLAGRQPRQRRLLALQRGAVRSTPIPDGGARLARIRWPDEHRRSTTLPSRAISARRASSGAGRRHHARAGAADRAGSV